MSSLCRAAVVFFASMAHAQPVTDKSSQHTTAQFAVRGNSQGLANRLGWYLTCAAIAASLNTSAPLLTTFPKARPGRCCNYEWRVLRGLVALPASIRVVDEPTFDAHMTARSPPRLIPLHPPPYINDYIPEPAWEMWGRWDRRRLGFVPRAATTRERFLAAYRGAQSELRPLAPLCNPAPRSYLALHLRRGDKAQHAARFKSDAGGLSDPVWAVLSAASAAIGAATPRRAAPPWLVLSDSEAARRAAERKLTAAGGRIVARGCGGGRVGSGGGGGGGAAAAAEFVSHAVSAQNTTAVVADFFALHGAAGVLATTPMDDRQESSYSTVAALAGDAPLLIPYPYDAKHGKMAKYQALGNGGRPLRGVFYAEDVAAFAAAVRDPALRYGPERRGS